MHADDGIVRPVRVLRDPAHEVAPLEVADREGFTGVATPAISTGAFGFPIDRAAQIALRTIGDLLPNLANLRTVRFVLFDQRALGA